ncbi:hypothetical protein [Nostoc sp. ChiQUE01b]|uniref:hypothetical protein n=1 Tax=Nostoc sp. ChiQUE01b TaxID=3075376 RepID=UPI002AD29AD6|nr:hypothetical protein [Nostoc sp. ChiQUE01b]MDZ8264362.1 hypothetical protein [Nostoc sp. ChiQUE01b]
MEISLIGEKAIALVCQTGAIAFVICAKNVVVQLVRQNRRAVWNEWRGNDETIPNQS